MRFPFLLKLQFENVDSNILSLNNKLVKVSDIISLNNTEKNNQGGMGGRGIHCDTPMFGKKFERAMLLVY
jgi:hypothetical protein